MVRARSLAWLAIVGLLAGCGGDDNPPAPDATTEVDAAGVDVSGADGGAAPTMPALLFPWSGWATGSVHATATAALPLRPRFRWRAALGPVTEYELQVDDSCGQPVAACDFPSPELDELIDAAFTEFKPTTDLPVSTTAPVGARYVWRVRACNGNACSDWAPPRYVDVGVEPSDLNCDGYADLVVGAPGQTVAGHTGVGAAFVFYGTATGLSMTPDFDTSSILNPLDYAQVGGVVAIGDLNGDLCADLIVAAPTWNIATTSEAGRVFGWMGGPAGISGDQTVDLESAPIVDFSRFGQAVAIGDLDADGYGDLAIGTQVMGAVSGTTYVYAGTATGPETTPAATLEPPNAGVPGASSLSAGADMNGDGYLDLALGARGADGVTTFDVGRTFFYMGGPLQTLTLTWTTQTTTETTMVDYGWPVVLADVNGDGYGDAVAGARFFDNPEADEGAVFVHFGSPGGPANTPDVTLDNPLDGASGYFGFGLSAGDLDGDGISDLVAGAWRNGALNEGEVYVFKGGASIPSTPSATITDQLPEANEAFGSSVFARGDFNGDGVGDVAVGINQNDFPAADAGRVFIYASAPGALPMDYTAALNNPGPTYASGYFGTLP